MFDLYEDEDVNYGHEKGRFSNIRFVWRDKEHKLLISVREGLFPWMPEHWHFAVSALGSVGQRSNTSFAYAGQPLSYSL